MYFDKKRIEQIRKEGEEKVKEMERDDIGRQYQSNGIDVTCVHCQHDRFELDRALLNTRVMSFLDIDWLNKSANILSCKRCGYIHWFSGECVERKED